MSTAIVRSTPRRTRDWPELQNGDRLTQPEFHRRYEGCPENQKFELIGGVVYMASPVGIDHSDYHLALGHLIKQYETLTPGVHALDNATVILGEKSEPQPDLALRILPEFGGQSSTDRKQSGTRRKRYVRGCPELIAEIAHSSVAIDLHQKKADYLQSGVREYLVVCLEEQEFHWFDFKSRGGLVKHDSQGIHKSRVFPGLWIDGPALLELDSRRLLKALEEGCASPEHAAFVQKLEAVKKRGK